MNETVLWLFCTYLVCQDRRTTEVNDNELRRNMINLINQHPEWNENEWVRHFVQLWRNSRDKLAKRHLVCYLERPLQKVAQQVYYQKIQPNLEQYPELPQSLCDVIQIGREFTWNLEWILEEYDINRPLSPYAKTKLKRRIIDSIFTGYLQSLITSQWALLKNSSKKRVRQALQQYFGRKSSEFIDTHFRVWECFKELYHPPTPSAFQPLREPNDEELKGMVELFDRHHGVTISSEKILSQLQTMTKALRDFSTQVVISSDAPMSVQDEISFSEERRENDLDIGNAQRLQEELSKILTQLERKEKALLFLRFGVKFVFLEIGNIFAVSQTTISRRGTSGWIPNLVRSIWNKLFQSLTENCNIDSSLVNIKYVQEILNNELFNQYYQHLILNLFDSVSISLNLPNEQVTDEQLLDAVVKYLSKLEVTFSEESLTILRNRLQPLIDLWRSINDNYQP